MVSPYSKGSVIHLYATLILLSCMSTPPTHVLCIYTHVEYVDEHMTSACQIVNACL